MLTHLIQEQTLFGPPERHAELKACWNTNLLMFDEITRPTERLTFTELLKLCKPDRINVIANSDIYFEAWPSFPAEGECWALSRWDVAPDGTCALYDHPDSQDAWVFNGVPPGINVPYPLGIPGVDNKIVFELRMMGVKVSNPAKTIRSYHLHNVNYRSYLQNGRKMERVPPPYGTIQTSWV